MRKPRRGHDVRRSGGFIISGLSGGHGLFHLFDQSLIVLLPEIKEAFALSEVGVGIIAATERTADGVMSAPAGVFTDMQRRRWGLVLAVCMGLFGLGWIVVGLAPAFSVLLVGIVMVAVASSVWHLPAEASLSLHFPFKRGTALSFHAVGGNVGDIIGPLVTTGVLLGLLSWRGILSGYAVAPLLLVVAVLWAFRNIGDVPGLPASTPKLRSQIEITRRLLKNRLLWGINAVSALRNMTYVTLITFLPLYFHDVLGMSFQARGFHLALLMFVGMFSTPLLGYASDRFGRKLVLVPTLLLMSLLTILLVPLGSGASLTILIALLSLFLFSDQPILTAAALDIVGHRVVNTTLGVLSLTRVLPSAAGPIIGGWLFQQYGIQATFYFVSGIFAAAAILMILLPLQRTAQRGSKESAVGE